MIILSSYVVGSVFLFIDKKIRPKKNIILLKELEILNLNQIGLVKQIDEINNEIYYAGKYREYYINIGVLYTGTSGLKGEVRTNIFIEYDRKKIKKIDKKIIRSFYRGIDVLTLINILKTNEEIDSDKYYKELNQLIDFLIIEKINTKDIKNYS